MLDARQTCIALIILGVIVFGWLASPQFDAVYVAKFLDDHSGAFTALASVVIASFTGFLWWSTHRLWIAANATLKQAQAIERPFLIPEITGMEHENLEGGRQRPIAIYVLRNHGRSPAIVRRFQDTHIIREHLPDDYNEVWDLPLSSRPGQYIALGQANIPTGQHFRAGLDPDHIGRTGRQYVIGRFQYDDVFGTSYIQGFCIQILAIVPTAPNTFAIHYVITGDNVYNYRRPAPDAATATP